MTALSAKNIIASLEKLITLHKELVNITKKKTEVIKKNDIDGLKKVTSDERKMAILINSGQNELMSHASETFGQTTLRECLPYMSEEDQQTTTELQGELVENIKLVKHQNDLNQQLLEQSLAFVQVSLDLLTPDLDNYNYERPDRVHPYEQNGRSLFDSNA